MATGTTITRRLPNSDDAISKTVKKALNTLGIVLPADVTVTAATKTRLIAVTPVWLGDMTARDTALSNRVSATGVVVSSQSDVSMLSRHFFMVFNFGVERGKYTPAQRLNFHLPETSDALPDMASEDNLILWAQRIVDGDVIRVAAGGAPMSNPTAAEVGTALTAFQVAKNDQTLKEAVYKASLDVINAARPEAEAVILKVWDETETFYNELPAPAKRDKGRLWGITYITKTPVTINLVLLNKSNGEPLDTVATHFEEGDTDGVTNALGQQQVITTVADLATFVSVKPGFTTITTEVPLVIGTLIYNIEVKMIPV
jgi:hypothetical protein